MTAAVVASLAVAIGLGLALATPTILRRLPEPAPARPDERDERDDPEDPAEVKLPYAALATHRFVIAVGVLAVAAIAVPAAVLPSAALPCWVVLGTLGLLLAAIDARTTWLPLSLTRVAWVLMGLAIGVGAFLGGWLQAVRGAVGFLLAGAVFGLIWLFTRGGFGFGDVRYAPLVGAATATVSWTLLPWALVLGSLAGALVGLVRLAMGRRGAFPYAPAILAGGYLAVVVAWLTT